MNDSTPTSEHYHRAQAKIQEVLEEYYSKELQLTRGGTEILTPGDWVLMASVHNISDGKPTYDTILGRTTYDHSALGLLNIGAGLVDGAITNIALQGDDES